MKSCTATSLSFQTPEWLGFLRLVCACAEGTFQLIDGSSNAATACVFAVLNDVQCRIAVMGGRAGMPRSLGSVFGGSVTRFLGGFRGRYARTLATPHYYSSYYGGVAMSCDGTALLLSDRTGHFVYAVSVHTGALLRTIGRPGHGPLQFRCPLQVWVASDGFVFVAEWSNNRIQVLTPGYDFYAFVGVGQLSTPHGVCATAQVIVVSQWYSHDIIVFNRNDGTLIQRFGTPGSGDGQLLYPADVCFMSGHRLIAVADYENCRVSVWTLQGEFVRHLGVGILEKFFGVASSDADELLVADCFNCRIVMFNARGEMVWSSSEEDGKFITSVATHGKTIFGHAVMCGECVVFS